ncbi:MAG: hypothetical protein WKF34_06705 [Pyrinomonadaceae bacterium]
MNSENEKAIVNGMQENDAKTGKCPARKWGKRAGYVAFFFFLGKGLVWLGVAAAGAYYALN